MSKTFDGIQAMAYLKQGYAVRRAEWLEPRHIHRGRAGGVICETGNSQPLHLDELFEGDWEFYCNPTAEPMEPTPGTWEWAKAAIEQGKKVRCACWVWDEAHLEMVDGRIVTELGQTYNPRKNRDADLATVWEEYIEPQATKNGMTWDEARVALAQGRKVRRAGWKYESARAYWPLTNSEDEEATDWEVVMDGDPILGAQNPIKGE